MQIKAFQLTTGDKNAGAVYMPDRASGRLPVLIHCHGWGSDGWGAPDPANVTCLSLTSRNVVNIKFDFYGAGKTGGDYARMSYGRWASNLNDVYAWVAQQEWADPERIGVYGISSGTTAALRFACAHRTPALVISSATALGLYIGMPEGPGKILIDNLDTLVGGGTAPVFGTQFSLDFFRDFIGNQPVYAMHTIKCPVLFLEGSADNPYRRSDGWLGYQIMKRKGLDATLIEVEGGDHGLGNREDEKNHHLVSFLIIHGFITN